jgi:hypothetical protein
MANDPTPVFLDANVLAGPVTRTLLLTGADASGQDGRRHQRDEVQGIAWPGIEQRHT